MTMNEAGNQGDSITVVLPEPLLDFIEHTRRVLIAVRVKHGANSPIGHRCSNIVEMLQNRAPPTAIANQMAELDRLLNGPQ